MKPENHQNQTTKSQNSKDKQTTGPDSALDSLQPELEAKITELTNDLQRTRADFENYRKQIELQTEHSISIAKHSTILKLLPLLDDIDRAISAHPAELLPVQKTLDKALKALELAKINSTPGTEFDPDFHEAVLAEGEGLKELISETLRPGYQYQGQVLRASLVKVQRS